jgi:GT2 family glycosyltransferase
MFQSEPSSSQSFVPSVSVIICAYTEARWDDLNTAIASLYGQTLPPNQIVIVVDYNDALLKRARERFEPQGVLVIENSQQRGLSGARNSGIDCSHSNVMAFMDEDAAAEPTWLASLVQHYANPAVMGVGGAIVPNWQAGRPGWFPEQFDWVVGCTYEGMRKTTGAVRNMIGCNMSVRRTVADQNGGFRHGIGRIGTLPVGCEETEYCIRARQRWPDQQFLFEPSARVLHNVPASRGSWRYFTSRCYAEGVSKAAIGQFIGAKSSLSSETTYVTRTLPKALFGNLLRAVTQLDLNALMRAFALVAGLGLTGIGFMRTRFALAFRRRTPTPAPHPQSQVGQL